MSTLREAAKEALRWMEHARLHLTIKERMHPDGLSLYDSAAEALRAALAQPESRPCTCHPDDNPPQPCAQRYALTECKALAQPETEAEPVVEPVAWEARWIDPEEGASYWVPTQNPDFYRSCLNYEVRPLYAHPPRDAWRPASEPPEDARPVLGRQKRNYYESVHFINGNWFVEATGRHTLTITHWRDVEPPTEGAK